MVDSSREAALEIMGMCTMYAFFGSVFADVALDGWREHNPTAGPLAFIGLLIFWLPLAVVKITYKIFQKILA